MNKKIAIIARDYILESDNTAYEMLRSEGYEIKIIDDGRFMSEDSIIKFASDADGLIVANDRITDKIISSLKNLKIISRRGVGLDAIDIESAKKHNIAVTRTTGKVGKGVAELVMAYIMAFSRDVCGLNNDMKKNLWNRNITQGLSGRTIGLIGFGGIGINIAKMANPFDMKIKYYARHRNEDDDKYSAEYVSLDELLKTSDYVSVNIPLTDETKDYITINEIKKMKKSAVLINVARSAIVNDEDLAYALNNGLIRGAAVDVFKKEPCTDSVLVKCPNCILTPHVGPFTESCFAQINKTAAENIISFFRNEGKYNEKQ